MGGKVDGTKAESGKFKSRLIPLAGKAPASKIERITICWKTGYITFHIMLSLVLSFSFLGLVLLLDMLALQALQASL